MRHAATATEGSGTAALPHWDLSTVWPSLTSPAFDAAFARTLEQVAAVRDLFDARAIGGGEEAARDEAATFDEVVPRLNDVLEAVSTLASYIYASVTTDSRDERAQARLSELRPHLAELSKLHTRLTAWLGRVDADGLLERSRVAQAHAFAVRRAQRSARHQMSAAEEDLAADLHLSGGGAWEKLYLDLTSQIEVPFSSGDEERSLPITEIRALAFDPDRDVRRRAYEAELAAWERNAVPLAAAMNSIKGEVNTLCSRRGWESPLDEALHSNNVDRDTVDAMFAAAREAFPAQRRYFRAKARLFGADRLPWFDLFAPMPATSGSGSNGRVWEYARAQTFIVENFGRYSGRLGGLAERAFRESWIDAEPRTGKTGGAFCMHLWKDESRILANYTPAYGGVSTLAHELGHAYHNLVRAPLTELQRRTPASLAETASTFCETIVRDAALEVASPAEQLEILEGSLQDNLQITIDVTSRFLFEQRVFERRLVRELSVDELSDLMLEAQRETYGDGLDGSALHAYMWAVKPHYYSAESFYNFPYVFGLLFGLGLYALYRREPDAFRARYDDLLASTGSADVAELAARFDIDVRSPEFWQSSLAVLIADVDRFEALTRS
jgi:oligoendopeptidase F